MNRYIRSFVLMITFLTRIPIPVKFKFNNEDFNKGFKYFPIVGAIIGGFLTLPFIIKEYLPDTIFAFIIIIVYLLVVGGLHIDGVADVFDGIFSARKQGRMLEIMEDSRIGAFGAIGLIIYFLGLYIGLFEVIKLEKIIVGRLTVGMVTVIIMPIIGRIMALISAGFSRYAKESGMGKSLIDENKPLVSVILIMLLCVVSFLVSIEFLIAVVATICIGLLITWRVHKILNGITGDVVGMILEVSQVVFLLAITVAHY